MANFPTDGDDTIIGTAFGEHINALKGNDFVNAGGGNDSVFGSFGNDVLLGLDGNDTLSGASGNDHLVGDSFLDDTSLFGNDTLIGGLGNDTLEGGRGNDTLSGGSGEDVLIGDFGADRLTGDPTGSGITERDRFDYNSRLDSGVGFLSRDVITDFQKGFDRIDLFNIDANAALSGGQAFTFIGANSFTGLGQLRVIHSGGNTIVQANILGGTSPDMEIELTGFHNLSGGDFFL